MFHVKLFQLLKLSVLKLNSQQQNIASVKYSILYQNIIPNTFECSSVKWKGAINKQCPVLQELKSEIGPAPESGRTPQLFSISQRELCRVARV